MQFHRRTDEEFKKELFEKNPNIEPLDIFTKVMEKIRVKCKICKHVWSVVTYSLLQGCGCPECAKKTKSKKLAKTNEEFKEELAEKNPNIELLETYINDRTKIQVKCKECLHEWGAYPTHLLRGTGCPICTIYSMEKPILKALKKKGIIPLHNYPLEESNYNGSKFPLRVDFIIETPKGKLAIEADGKQHFKEWHTGKKNLKHIQEKDRYKDKILKERGYILIRVTSSPTKEWGFKNHITMRELFELIERGINSETGEIDFELFRQYDFNRD